MTRIDTREDIPESWSRGTEQQHRFDLHRYRGVLIELDDMHLNHQSAVFLANAHTDPIEEREDTEVISALAVLRAVYLYLEENEGHKVLVVGHGDTHGPETRDHRLTELRALIVVAALEGDMDAWVDGAIEKSRVEDYQQILRWAHQSFGWLCDPVEIDNDHGDVTSQALHRFKAAYNEEFEGELELNGEMNRETWEAMFDLYLRELAACMDTDLDGLDEYRDRLQWVDDGRKGIGCGAQVPIDRVQLEGYRSIYHRRVEIMVFEPEHLPNLDVGDAPAPLPPGMSNVYHPYRFRLTYHPVEPAPQLTWLDLQTVNDFGQRVPDYALSLESEGADALEITTDEDGYWSDRVRVGRELQVWTSEHEPVRFGASVASERPSGGQQLTVVITPRVASRTITDLVVPVLEEDDVEEQRRIVRRYGRTPSTNGDTARAGSASRDQGEEAGEQAQRGGEDMAVTRRTFGRITADNLFIAAGWASNGEVDDRQLLSLIDEWLGDYYPTCKRRGYFIDLLRSRQVKLIDGSDQSTIGTYNLIDNRSILGRFGAHAALEYSAASEHWIFRDLRSASTGIGIRHDPPPDGVDPDIEADSSRETTVVLLNDIIAANQRDGFQRHYDRLIGERRVELAYLVPPGGVAGLIARNGGTGLLENYPGGDSAMNQRVHDRNRRVVSHADSAYGAYIRAYVNRVRSIDVDPSHAERDGLPHPEVQLHRLGPPESSFIWPRPVGCTDQQYRELLEQQSNTALDAWRAISDKLNAIYGVRPEGSLWLNVEFSAEAGNYAGPLSGAKVNLNFEVNEEGRVTATPGSETSVTLNPGVVTGPNAPGNAQYSERIDEATGRRITKVNFTLGKYGIESDSDGNMKFSVGPAFSQFNAASAQGEAGYEVSLRDLLVEGWYRRRGQEPPDWVSDMPDVKSKVSVGFQLLRMGTTLRIVSDSPGFFQMRPREEFSSVDWDSLYFDEQASLEVLEFDREKWDSGELPSTCTGQWAALTAQQMHATLNLPVPNAEPYWQEYWASWRRDRLSSIPSEPQGS